MNTGMEHALLCCSIACQIDTLMVFGISTDVLFAQQRLDHRVCSGLVFHTSMRVRLLERERKMFW